MTKICALCGIDLPASEFSIKKGRPGQKVILKSRCKKCVVRQYMEKYYNKPPRLATSVIADGHKKCIVCQTVLPYNEFHRECKSPTRAWHYSSKCKKCAAIANNTRIKTSGYVRPSENTIEHYLIESKRKNVVGGFHKHGGKLLPFTIGVIDVRRILSAHCSATNVKLNYDEPNSPLYPSIDRIDNNKGYEPGNIRITSLLYNLIRNKWTDNLITKCFTGEIDSDVDVGDCIRDIFNYNKKPKNYQFDLEAFISQKRCQLTNMPLINQRLHPLSPSFDRINFNLGYVDGNVRLTSLMANIGRNRYDDATFLDAFNKTKEGLRSSTVVAEDFSSIKYQPTKRYLFVDEFRDKFDIIFTQKPEIFLRPQKVNIRLIKAPNDFYNRHHYIGEIAAKYHIGVFFADQLIACMSIRRPTRQKAGDWEIARMASDPKYHVHGLWSFIMKRLFEYGISGKIVSYSDKRLFTGNVYEKMGMAKERDVPQDYYWSKDGIRYHKSGLRKTKEERLLDKTERELREAEGYKQVWDLGKIKWSTIIGQIS